jgi:enoyl-CoA hydratase/carnithine racemase
MNNLPPVPGLSCSLAAGTATLAITRPERRNAFTQAMYRGLGDWIVLLDRDPSVRCVVVRGSGGVFTSGSDIAHVLEMGNAEREAHFQLVASLLTAPSRIGKPVIAAVQGVALGGGTGLAAACDFVLADESARFGLPEVDIGLWPCTLLPALVRAIGTRKAYEMALLGDRVGAREAQALGLVNRVVAAEAFEAALAAITQKICAASPVVVQMGKRSFQQALDMDFQAATRVMGQVMALNSGTADAKEGIGAFLERRKPVWTGA